MSRKSEHADSRQDTFLSIGACLEKTAAKCRAAADSLQAHLGEVDSPYREALAEMVDTERELAELLANYADHGPKNVLDTRVQFNLHLPEARDNPTSGEAVKHLQATNLAGVQNLREQVSNTIPPDVVEELDTLWRDAEALGRRISVIHTTMRDV